MKYFIKPEDGPKDEYNYLITSLVRQVFQIKDELFLDDCFMTAECVINKLFKDKVNYIVKSFRDNWRKCE